MSETKNRSCSLLKTAQVLQMMSEAAVAADHARLTETPDSNPAPDSDGRRYCRHCRELRPLSAFPAGPRRYICKAHLYERVKLPAKLRVQADEKRRVLSQLWARCRTDSRALGQTRIQLAQRLCVCDLSLSSLSSLSKYGVCACARAPSLILCALSSSSTNSEHEREGRAHQAHS